MLSKRDRKLIEKTVEIQQTLLNDKVMSSRKKNLILEEKITYLCFEGWRNPSEVSILIGKPYNYVRRTMRSMWKDGELELEKREDGNKTRRFYRTPIQKILNDFGIERVPFHARDGRLITESELRRNTYLRAKKLFDKKGWKIGK